MIRAPKGRKRQFSKNRLVGQTDRCRSADVLANGDVRGKFGGEIVMTMPSDGVEHRTNLTDRHACCGAGIGEAIAFFSPCGERRLWDRCRLLLWHFGKDWCLKARFVGCRFTVADVLAVNSEPGVKLNDCVQRSLDTASRMWMLSVPSIDPYFDPAWLEWGEETRRPDFSSAERKHTYSYRPASHQ